MHKEIFNQNQIQLLPLVKQFKREFYMADGTAIALYIGHRRSKQMNLTINDVKFTFFQYIFKINANEKFEDILRLPTLIDLAAMKAYALGRWSKWKDYVDLYFILKDYYTLKQISERATILFDQLFSEKLFRAQLSYFEDIDNTEPVEFVVTAVPEDEIKEFLIDKATDLF